MMRHRFLAAGVFGGAGVPTIALAQPAESVYGPGMMWGGGMVHMFFGFIMMLLFLAAIIALVVLAVRWLSSSGHHLFGRTETRIPLDILRERLARGEIDVAEFEERRRALGE